MALLLLAAWFLGGAYMQIRLCHDVRSERQRVVMAFIYWPMLLAQVVQAFLINVFVLFGGGWKAFKQYREKVDEEEARAMVDILLNRGKE